MDESLTNQTARDVGLAAEENKERRSPNRSSGFETAAPCDKPSITPPLDLNKLQELSAEKMEALAHGLDLHLHPARSRHQHILDVVRAA